MGLKTIERMQGLPRTRVRRVGGRAAPRALSGFTRAAIAALSVGLILAVLRGWGTTRLIELGFGVSLFAALGLLAAAWAGQPRVIPGRSSPLGVACGVAVVLLGVLEFGSWGVAAFTGDPSYEASPSFGIYHGCTGESMFGGEHAAEPSQRYL